MSTGSSTIKPDAPSEGVRRTVGMDAWARALAEAGAAPVEAGLEQTVTSPTERAAERVKLPGLSLASGDEADLVPVRVLGEGVMGVITLARQQSLGREVAIKQVRPDARGEDSTQSLIAEAAMTGALEHPNIVPVHALGLDAQGAPAMIMKRVEGVAWAELIADPAHPALRALVGDEPGLVTAGARLDAHLRVFEQLCNALHFAHSRGVIHRDLKPENVMIGSFGEVYLLDWGIAMRPAALTEAQRGATALTGTPCFMAPEQVNGRADALGVHTDVYLLGATLHAVLTGQPRHRGARVPEVLVEAEASAPVSYGAEVPADLAALCNAATHRDPSQRPESALAVRRAVETFLRRRSSIDSAAAAHAALVALEQALPVGADARGALLRAQATWQTLTAARLGFAQALRGWSANAVAIEGARRCLSLLLERELALGNAEAAASLLEELGGGSADQQARVAALRAEAERLRAQDLEAKREVFERDFSVSSRARAALFGAFAIFLLAAGIPGAIHELRTGEVPDADANIVLDVCFLLIVGVPTLLARRKLLVNRVARTLVLSLLLALFVGMISDVFSVLLKLDGRTASIYSLTATGSTLTGSLLWTQPRAALSGVFFLLAAALTVAFPRGSTLFGVFGTLLSMGMVVWASRPAPGES